MKNIPCAEFINLDLNKKNAPQLNFDLVTCFETLEHVGNIENALSNLFNHLKKGGTLIIAIPNETGLVGLAKFIGRLLVRKNPYGDFFLNQSKFKYIMHLLRNDYIDIFRAPDKLGYGPHLGFDYRKIEQYINNTYLRKKELTLINHTFTFLNMNMTYVFERPKAA